MTEPLFSDQPMTPALSEDQWRGVHNEPSDEWPFVRWGIDADGNRWCDFNREYPIPLDQIPGEIAALNDALPDDSPHKITLGTVNMLRSVAGGMDPMRRGPVIEAMNRLANALETYLPPPALPKGTP